MARPWIYVAAGAAIASVTWMLARGGGRRVETRIVDVARPAPAVIAAAPRPPAPATLVRGRITRAHAPVGAAVIVARGPGYVTATSAADGTFTLGLPAPGRWQLAASSDALGASSRVITAKAATDAPIALHDLELAYGASIAGAVLDERGAPVAGVVVLAQDLDEHDFGHATTGPDGRFRIRALSGGDGAYELRVVAGDRDDTPVPLAPGTKPPSIELADGDAHVDDVALRVIAPPPRDAGTLHVALAGFAAPPELTLRPLGARTAAAYVADAPLAPGAYLVQASAGPRSDAAIATITAGARATITLRARPPAHVTGRVIGPGRFDCAAAPVAIAEAGFADAPPVRTDAQGRFALDVPSGPAEVHCWPVDGAASDVARRLALAPGARSTIEVPAALTLPPAPR